jgi:hypothetical protein
VPLILFLLPQSLSLELFWPGMLPSSALSSELPRHRLSQPVVYHLVWDLLQSSSCRFIIRCFSSSSFEAYRSPCFGSSVSSF